MENPDAQSKVQSAVCGDIVQFYLKVENNIIKEITFDTCGCLSSIANAEAAAELATGKTIDEAMQLKREDIIEWLGGIPEVKYHCAQLAFDSLMNALNDYKEKHKKD